MLVRAYIKNVWFAIFILGLKKLFFLSKTIIFSTFCSFFQNFYSEIENREPYFFYVCFYEHFDTKIMENGLCHKEIISFEVYPFDLQGFPLEQGESCLQQITSLSWCSGESVGRCTTMDPGSTPSSAKIFCSKKFFLFFQIF